MPQTLPKLLQPYHMRDLALANRVAMSPMTRARAGKSRIPNDLMTEYYCQRASAGLIITEGVHISQEAIGWVDSAGIWTDEQTTAWAKLVDSVHAAGGKIFLQLWHCGRASHSSFFADHRQPVAPSAIAITNDMAHTPDGKQPYEVPRALEAGEIARVVEDYKKAAQNCKKAGFDGVEIHAANGYLLDTFLQSKTNHRTDEYGGSLANRYRILGEVVAAVSEAYPSNRVGVKIGPNGNYNDMGSPDYRETFLYVAEQLDKCDLAYLQVVDGITFGFHDLGAPLELAEVRKVYGGVLMGNCGYTYETAVAAIDSGNADMISFGRPYITNPDLVERFEHGWPLAEQAPMSLLYSTGAKGYTDFPKHAQEVSR